MFRIKLLVIIGGGALAFFGYQEFRVSSGTSQEAESVELSALETGGGVSNHVRVGDHVAIYPASVYAYTASRYSSGDPSASASVDYSYYPILSLEHPFVVALKELAESEDSENISLPDLDSFRVLVKTRRFDTIAAIPDSLQPEQSVQGLIINQIDSLDSDEEDLIRQSFPSIDIDKVLILEDGRKPSSPLKWGGMLGGGVLLVLVGIAWMFLGGGRS